MGREYVVEELLVTPGVFTGWYPEIPIPSDVNLAMLTKNDPDPMFVTLPIMHVGATSRNMSNAGGKLVNRRYGREAATALVKSVNEQRFLGTKGHPEPGKRSQSAAALRWVAAALHGDTAWGKFYVLPHRADVRDELRSSMAANAKTATSLWGTIHGVRDDGEVIDLLPTNIDLVDPHEAGITGLGSVPYITRETLENEEGDMPDNGDLVSELRGQRESIQEQLNTARTQISELESRVSVLEEYEATVTAIREMIPQGDLVQNIREMQVAVNEFMTTRRQNKIEQAITEALGEIVQNERGAELIREMVGTVDSPDAARLRVEELLAKPHIREMLQLIVSEMGGPAAIVSGDSGGNTGKIDDSPEALVEARRQWGF